MEPFDVIIVGAGPAGSLLGYYLALQHISVLIIEKKKLPRHKVCGGGLSNRSLNIIPFDISEVIESYSHSVHITINNRSVFEHTASSPLIGMVMRDKFDYLLTQKAMCQGAAVMDETKFNSVKGNAGSLTIETSKGSFKAKILVGADGVYSKVAKALSLDIQNRRMIGLESEIYIDDKEILNAFTKHTSFDIGVIPKGYGWIFPKREHLSIGVVSVSKKINKMKQYLYRYHEAKNLKNYSNMKSLRGWRIPYAPSKNTLYANEKGLLVGDAAGLADPITGEGIFYALKEAELASQIITDNLLLGKRGLRFYNDALEPLRKDLSYASKLQGLLYYIPRISYKIMDAHGNRLGKKYLDIITGKTTYFRLYKQVFSMQGIKTLFST